MLSWLRGNDKQRRCLVDLYGTEISKLKFDYSRFKILNDDSRYSRSQLTHVYEQILQMQKAQGFLEGAEVADKEYRHTKYTYNKTGLNAFIGSGISVLERLWWDYGYKKWLIFPWTICALLFFTILNRVFFRHMNERVYMIKEVYTKDNSVCNSVDAFFYTCLIFFGLRLSVDKINFKNRGGVIYLFVQYMLGLICLAYLANFVIQQ